MADILFMIMLRPIIIFFILWLLPGIQANSLWTFVNLAAIIFIINGFFLGETFKEGKKNQSLHKSFQHYA